MTAVPGGTRLVLQTAQGAVVLRTVRAGCLDPDGSLPVLAPVEALLAGTGLVELPTATGLLAVRAHLTLVDGVLALRCGEAQDAVLRQRRDDVRWPLVTPFRAAPLDSSGEDLMDAALCEGRTTSLSGGGLCADVSSGGLPTVGSRVFVELELPGPVPVVVPVVIEVIAACAERPSLRGRFLDIAPIDRERIVRLVFAEQRRELAERRRHREALALPE